MKAPLTAILFLFLCSAVWAQSSADSISRDTVHGSISGPGFTVTLPPDVEMDVAPNADLAYGLNLAEKTHGREWERLPFRYIGFSTQWHVEADSLNELVYKMTSNLESLVPYELASEGSVVLSTTFPATLGDLPARRLVLEFKNKQKKPSVRQIVVGFRSRKDADPVVYLAILNTTRVDFPQDVNLFAKLLAGFKITPIQ